MNAALMERTFADLTPAACGFRRRETDETFAFAGILFFYIIKNSSVNNGLTVEMAAY